MKKSFPSSRVYGLREPGPVVRVTTAYKGRANVMSLSWLTRMDFVPPLIGMVLSHRNYSFAALTATPQCVINIPAVELARKVVAVGSCSGRRVDKFAKCRLTPRPAKRVEPPLIDKCYASLECRVVDARLAKQYNFVILEALKAWIGPARKHPRTRQHFGRGRLMVAGRTLTLRSRKNSDSSCAAIERPGGSPRARDRPTAAARPIRPRRRWPCRARRSPGTRSRGRCPPAVCSGARRARCAGQW